MQQQKFVGKVDNGPQVCGMARHNDTCQGQYQCQPTLAPLPLHGLIVVSFSYFRVQNDFLGSSDTFPLADSL